MTCVMEVEVCVWGCSGFSDQKNTATRSSSQNTGKIAVCVGGRGVGGEQPPSSEDEDERNKLWTEE